MPTIAEISVDQLRQLQTVEPSLSDPPEMEYYPCMIKTSDGGTFDRVYVQELSSLIERWGIPMEHLEMQPVRIESVVQIESSPSRLPVGLANKLYQAGESGMGYVIFTVVLNDGRRLPYVTGNAVDFPQWPAGVTPEMVKEVLPHVGREHFQHRMPFEEERSASFLWCAYRPSGAGRFHIR